MYDDYNNNENNVDKPYEEGGLIEEQKSYEVDDKTSKEESYNKPIKKKRKKSFRGSLLSYVIVVLIASIIGGLMVPYIGANLYGTVLPNPYMDQYGAEEDTNEYLSNTNPINISPRDDITRVTAVARKAISSVVGITTLEEVQQTAQLPFWFFGPEGPRVREGTGSGVIVDSSGYILTNSHVIADGNAKSVNVLFENGDKEEAQIVWADPLLDLAVLKINKTGLRAADLGDSEGLEIGELAVAIGNPLGHEFQQTVTDGIISGLNRTISLEGRVVEDLIQTNASINPGNSGGPLLNDRGQVIGINTAKIKGGEGIGFAIPINKAKSIVEEIIETGSYINKEVYGTSKGTVILGISSYSLKDYEAMFGIDFNVEKGIIIVQVHAGTPAHKAGILNGDIVTKIGKTEIKDTVELVEALQKYKQGDKETLTIIRTGQEIKVQVEFTEVN